jgi:hypothetical protein
VLGQLVGVGDVRGHAEPGGKGLVTIYSEHIRPPSVAMIDPVM